jgi:hypothetical protein
MSTSRIFGFDPVESILVRGPFTFAKALAFAAMRAESAAVNDDGPASTQPTIPAPPVVSR